jgi:hypothetical protein
MIKVVNPEALKLFNKAVKSISDFTPALKEVNAYQIKQIDEAFKVSGKNIIGTQWERLKPSTLKEKMASGYLTNILVRNGKLRNSFKKILLDKTKLQITSVGVDYFEQHQLGKPAKNLPRRQILGHSQEMINKTLDIFRKYIINTIKKNG